MIGYLVVIFTYIYIYIYILLPSPTLPNSLRLRPSLIRPSLLSSASRLRRPPARRRRHPLPCLFSSLNRASFPLTKTLPPSPSLSTDFSSLPLRNPAADGNNSGGRRTPAVLRRVFRQHDEFRRVCGEPAISGESLARSSLGKTPSFLEFLDLYFF